MRWTADRHARLRPVDSVEGEQAVVAVDGRWERVPVMLELLNVGLGAGRRRPDGAARILSVLKVGGL
jgi:hypothetical protein